MGSPRWSPVWSGRTRAVIMTAWPGEGIFIYAVDVLFEVYFWKGSFFCLWFGNHIHFLMDLEWYQHFFSTKVLILSIFFKALNIWTWCFGYSTFANTIVFWLHCCGSKVHVWRLNFWRVVFGRWYQKTESFLSG